MSSVSSVTIITEPPQRAHVPKGFLALPSFLLTPLTILFSPLAILVCSLGFTMDKRNPRLIGLAFVLYGLFSMTTTFLWLLTAWRGWSVSILWLLPYGIAVLLVVGIMLGTKFLSGPYSKKKDG